MTFFLTRPSDIFMSHGLADKNYLLRRGKDGRFLAAKYRRILVAGEWLRSRLLKETDIDPSKIVVVGWPRLPSGNRNKPDNLGQRRRVLWAPTLYSENGASSYPEFLKFVPMMESKFDFSVSLHPADRGGGKPTSEQLKSADIVVSDHGTLVYEAWALGIPVVFPSWLISERVQNLFPGSAEAAIFEGAIGNHAGSFEELLYLTETTNNVGHQVDTFISGYVSLFGESANQAISQSIIELSQRETSTRPGGNMSGSKYELDHELSVLEMRTETQSPASSLYGADAAITEPMLESEKETLGNDLISVIVPAHNVAEYVEECLTSILRQAVDLEVIFIDDGSTDDTVTVAQRIADNDGRVVVLQQANLGPGPARNLGLQRATGRYLAFADADDYLLPGALPRMLERLKKDGADFVSANVLRLDAGRFFQSALHAHFAMEDVTATHISKNPELLWDSVIWNKLYYRDFFMAHVGAFPDMLYEDMAPMVRVHLAASNVSIVADPVYVWRARPDNSSITQGRSSLRALRDRMVSTREIIGLLTDQPTQLRSKYEDKILRNDLPLYMATLADASREFKETYLSWVLPVLRSCSSESLRALPLPEMLLYQLIKRSRINDISPVLPFTGKNPSPYPIVRDGSRLIAELPFRTGWNRLPSEIFDVTDRLELRAAVTEVIQTEYGCELKGYAFIDGLPPSGSSRYRIQCNLVSKGRDPIPLRVFEIPAAARYLAPENGLAKDYAAAGFSASIDFVHLSSISTRSTKVWELKISLEVQGISRATSPGLESETGLSARQYGQFVVSPANKDDKKFQVRVEPIHALLQRHFVDSDGSLRLSFSMLTEKTIEALRFVIRNTGALLLEQSLNPAGSDSGVEAVLSEESLKTLTTVGNKTLVDVMLVFRDGKQARARTIRDFEPFSHRLADALLEFRFTPAGNFVVECTRNAVIIQSSAVRKGTLFLKGATISTGQASPKLQLHNEETGEVANMFSNQFGDSIEASLNLLHVERWKGYFGPLPVGKYSLTLDGGGSADFQIIVPDASGASINSSSLEDGMQFDLERTNRYEISLELANRLPADARGTANQNALQTKVYGGALTRPVRPLVLFDAWNGKRIDDNPLAIYRELSRVRPDLELLFATADRGVYVPQGVRSVRKWSSAYWEALGSAWLLIVNDRFPAQLRKRAKQYCVQTWHGTPLKRIGFDIDNPRFDPSYKVQLEREVEHWNLLLSPNTPSTERFRSAFNFTGEIVETGYPRNDLLNAPDRDLVRARVRAGLGLHPSEMTILYAPTWRDNQKVSPGKYSFDLSPRFDVIQRNAQDVKILFRGHHLMLPPDMNKQTNVINVSSYPDIAELYLAADVLVSDYSSAIVDFSVTGKPIILFVPDLVEYSTDIRGFYNDFIAEAPAQIVSHTDALVHALNNIKSGEVSATISQKYELWNLKYTALDDGNAAQRTVSRLLAYSMS